MTWEDVKEYENIYKVSSLGEIKKVSNGRILTLTKSSKYLKVNLLKNGKSRTFDVHRIVCLAFHSNPQNKATVNHKNGDKLDNRAENLEWNTVQENQIHAYKTGLKRVRKGFDNLKTQVILNTDTGIYYTISQAAFQLNKANSTVTYLFKKHKKIRSFYYLLTN